VCFLLDAFPLAPHEFKMPDLTGMLLIVVVLALLFDFSNGWHDSANAIATVVSTRVVSPFVAVIAAAVLNVVGAFMSTAVAKMVGSGIVNPTFVTQEMVAAALAGAGFLGLVSLAPDSGVYECPALAAPKEEQYERRYEQRDAASRERAPGRRCDRCCYECHVRRTQKTAKNDGRCQHNRRGVVNEAREYLPLIRYSSAPRLPVPDP